MMPARVAMALAGGRVVVPQRDNLAQAESHAGERDGPPDRGA